MGRPFRSELGELEDTYEWATRQDVTALRDVLRNARGPLLAVGSGGSFTAASHAAFLHEEAHGQIARAATPLDSVDVSAKLRGFHMLLISSGGRNRDGLQACDALLRAEPASATILTASHGSPLAKLGRRYDANVFEYRLPVPRDGFLATNSLFAFCALIGRAYGDANLPSTLAGLVGTRSVADFAGTIASNGAELFEREVLLVLHGASCRAAALDVESKFSEAALGSVHVSDYRNFGHGRHHWLAKRADQTGVVAYVHETERALAQRTLAQLPRDVPRLCIPLSGDSQRTMLSGLLAGYHLVAAVGRQREIDPGRPGVPAFGSRLYSLRMREPSVPTPVVAAARRKSCHRVGADVDPAWQVAARQAVSVIADARFSSVAIDYDGTLCSARERFGIVRPEISSELIRLGRAGLRFGIATGRGKSVRDALRKSVPKRLWTQIRIGYYNGGVVAGMAEDLPPGVLEPRKELRPVLRALREAVGLDALATLEPRNPQITVECRRSEDAECVWEIVQRCVAESASPGVTLVRSSHSIDVLAPTVSKLAVVDALPGPVLRIGDKGRFPGNDFALLDDPLGLSVDEVSPSVIHCWNLLPAGYRGVVGTLEYLRAIRKDGKRFRLELAGDES
jgi:fructoselysine-6-P-deglycase FrlB-like protein